MPNSSSMHNATFPTKIGKTEWASAVTGQGNLTGHQLLQVNVLRYTKKVKKKENPNTEETNYKI